MDLKNIPILGEIDFSDPEKKKRSILICMAAALLILTLIVALVKKASEGEEATVAQTESTYESLQLPLGQSKEQLQGKTIRDISARRGTDGGRAKDLFSDDPLADLMGEGKGQDGNESPATRGEGTETDQPEFMRRHTNVNTDVFPERPAQPEQPVESQKPQPAAKRQQAATASNTVTNPEDLTSLSFEERRKLLYAQNGLDPETGEPSKGGPFDASQARENAGRSGGGPSSSSSSGKSTSNSGNSAQPTSPKPATDQETKEVEVPEQPRAQIRRSGGVSSFGAGGSSAGRTITSISDQDVYVDDDPSRPIKVKFSYDQKVSSGQRISIRLCEDMIVDGILLPTNTHIFATCTVGERLKIQVNSIEVNGKIYNVKYTAYDNDGVEGLYCPQSSAVKATEQAAEQAGQLAQSAVQGAVTGYPGRILQAGAQLVRTAKGNTAVNVTAGYAFFLMQDN